MIRVLSVTSECAPLVKTGGLADVAGALPGALAPHGVEMRTLLPGYPAVTEALGRSEVALSEADLWGGPAVVRRGRAAGLDLYVLDAPHLFGREGGPYLGPDGRDWPDNPERFAALSWVAARIATEGARDWRPQVLHGHDWQAGLAPVYVRETAGAGTGAKAAPGLLFTIHNIAFQGLAPADRLNVLRLPGHGFTPGGFEYFGQISALKAGILWSDRITTVSPTYAAELMTAEFGMGMEGVLRSRAEDFSGILNGIDTEAWSPTTAEHPFKTPRGKGKAQAALREELALPEGPGPLCVVVSRLTEQKGLDMVLAALPRLMAEGAQLALLGSGDPGLESAFLRAADAHAAVAVRIGYDEALARRLIAGGDAILVPSRFEPCGLTQLYGLRFGTLPCVTLTGGLADTVIDANPAAMDAGVATGFQAHPVSPEAVERRLVAMCRLFRDDPKGWERMQRNAMRQPVGWDRSAAAYAALYAAIARPAP